MEEILRFAKISFSYDKERIALNDLSVSLYTSEKVAVLGNNGAGKSTFFLCCNGIVKPKSGEIYFKKNKFQWTRKENILLRQAVGLIFQDPDNQIIAGTVEAEISFGPMNLKLDENTVRKQVDDAITNMQLEEMRLRAPHYLSGGEKKRVSIADVLAMNPQLLLLDEPGASLDPANTSLLEKNLDMLTEKGLGLVIATHDVDFAWRWADRILVFHRGEVVADADPETVFSNSSLLNRCGLAQPILYQVGKIFNMNPLPRVIADVRKMSELPRSNK
ncbi:energy-coupling factor ABC transporter ATP-binding protein [Anaerocolumna sp. MB42-C2]|uniref:energy-coupling factor ABC transporter ATP-binding protein n=1 Tax=Anaerocolumna sp. MB42-C2 TaxID=3070997 RepID=UPI0027E02556|nr:ABC transporter ATP-binding protein [Anaerocolumna sp. MB42-C2]WMJ87244.1 ABC transporter ATP-binding protein [Anaerocolumna sp. MB42-C2]